MHGLIRTLVGASALGAAFVSGLAVAGHFAQGAPPPPGSPISPVSVTGPDALTGFEDCTELLAWYVDHHLDEVGPWGWDWGHRRYDATAGDVVLDGTADLAAPTAPQSLDRDARTSSETGTNTQEVGVDEPDTAKTDGRVVVHLDATGTLVVTDVSGTVPRRLGELTLPAATWHGELLLAGDHVLVVAADPFGAGSVTDLQPSGKPAGARIVDVDITDPARPEVVETWAYDGRIESVRQYGDVVRVVVEKARPELPWALPGGDVSEDEARERNRALLRQSRIEDWLPTAEALRSREVSTVDCADVHRPSTDAGDGTVAVFTRTVGSDETASVAVTTSAEVVYSSPDRLYVATSDRRFDVWQWGVGTVTGRPAPPTAITTQLHAFALDGADTSYVASGHVDGTVRDRWSLDEQDGDLRVALARLGRHGGTVDNAVVVLDEELRPRGAVTGLGIDEDIQSVRWFEDFAVVVTFRQVDPLYTISFADPARPRLLGELKIPGFSAYLHPLGQGRLLGLGQDATLQGSRLGAQAAVFDIERLTDPRQVARHRFPQGSELLAGFDPRAFTWVPDGTGGTAYTLLRRGWWAGPVPDGLRPVPPEYDGGLAAVALAVRGDQISVRTLEARADERTRMLPLAGGQVVLVGPEVRILG